MPRPANRGAAWFGGALTAFNGWNNLTVLQKKVPAKSSGQGKYLNRLSMRNLRCFCLVVCCCMIVFGCDKAGTYQNPYYNRMKKLADQVEADPKDKTALSKLEGYTKSWDEWDRFYAYGSIYMLAGKNIGGCRDELIPYIDNALKDPDQATRREAASAICDIGATAVEQTLPTLLQIIQKYQEEDDVWFSIIAVGQLQNRDGSAKALPILFKAAHTPPPEGTQEEAPQMRYYALDSIEKLAKTNGLNVIGDLETLMNESSLPYKTRVASVISELDSTNSAAQVVLTNSIPK